MWISCGDTASSMCAVGYLQLFRHLGVLGEEPAASDACIGSFGLPATSPPNWRCANLAGSINVKVWAAFHFHRGGHQAARPGSAGMRRRSTQLRRLVADGRISLDRLVRFTSPFLDPDARGACRHAQMAASPGRCWPAAASTRISAFPEVWRCPNALQTSCALEAERW